MYESGEDLRRRVLPYVRQGLAAGDAVQVIASRDTEASLGAGLGADADRVRWGVPGVTYRSLGPMFGGLRDYLARQARAGRRVRLVAEGPPIADPARAGAYLRFEAASNDVLGAYGFPWVCLYDRRRHSGSVLEQVEQVHPHLLDPVGEPASSARFRDPDDFLRAHPGLLSPIPAAVDLDLRLTAADQLSAARREAAAGASARGLPGEDVDDFELAAGELLSNAVRHGQRPCRLRLWATDSHVVVRVDDTGPGDDLPTKGFRPPRPALGHLGGMGMWVIRQVADAVHVCTSADGTAVEAQFHRRGPAAEQPRAGEQPHVA
ncbi:sensor histidine kinase [Pseudonocardia broussonetiae]|uniref:Sensor histidine kinase n=1 Tax=Pseudonocardia broussonetiae TaxID=2736640 RepID=A0A6M6JRP1_9PSEU|nr:sensor histidine kinase [Pseudonocardia broussonetiae]QJY49980.1 sensor histidine kinase [Pseudonocardia broussonetiae]